MWLVEHSSPSSLDSVEATLAAPTRIPLILEIRKSRLGYRAALYAGGCLRFEDQKAITLDL